MAQAGWLSVRVPSFWVFALGRGRQPFPAHATTFTGECSRQPYLIEELFSGSEPRVARAPFAHFNRQVMHKRETNYQRTVV